MRSMFTSWVLWGASIVVWILPLRAQADFIIEFPDGHKVTVGRYFEEGKTIKIYTPQGAIGFPKAEVKRILSVDAKTGAETPLEQMLGGRPVGSSSTATSVSSEEKNSLEGKDKTATKTGGRTGRKDPQAERAELTEQYHDTAKQLDSLWSKHLEDVERGASIEPLEENRRQMNALNHQRNELIRSARQGNQSEIPDWAQ